MITCLLKLQSPIINITLANFHTLRHNKIVEQITEPHTNLLPMLLFCDVIFSLSPSLSLFRHEECL